MKDPILGAVVAGYTILAVAAGGRAAVQLPSHPSFAHWLTTVAAVVYLIGALLLRRPQWLRVARVVCSAEFVGVLVVGTLSLADTSLFTDRCVWSDYGAGYGFLPLVLPLLALWRLRRTST